MGTSCASRTAWLVADILESAGQVIGLATEQGVEIGGSTTTSCDSAGAQVAYITLNDPTTTAAALRTSGDSIAREGLGIDRLSVGVVIPRRTEEASDNPASDASILGEVTTHFVVLDATSPQATYLAEKTRAKRLCWVARDPGLPLFDIHIHLDVGGAGHGISDAGGKPEITLWNEAKPASLVPYPGLNRPSITRGTQASWKPCSLPQSPMVSVSLLMRSQGALLPLDHPRTLAVSNSGSPPNKPNRPTGVGSVPMCYSI